jgi:hypothetical protein
MSRSSGNGWQHSCCDWGEDGDDTWFVSAFLHIELTQNSHFLPNVPYPLCSEPILTLRLELITCLLTHLSIPHVALAAHCAGTIPLLNLLVRHRSLLDPVAPYMAVLAPWVHPSESGVMMLAMANWLPAQLTSQFHRVIRFGNTYISPMIGLSSGLSIGLSVAGPEGILPDQEYKSKVQSLITDYLFAEETSSGSQDSVICLRKKIWGAFDSWEDLVPNLAAVETAREERNKLRVQVFHAANDALVGKGGMKYWDECWRIKSRGENIEYESQIVDTDHDGLCAPENGAMGQIFDAVTRPAGLTAES